MRQGSRAFWRVRGLQVGSTGRRGRFGRLIGVLALLSSLVAPSLAGAAPATVTQGQPVAEPPRVERVYIVLAPYLQWSDVTEKGTPGLWALARSGAVGNMNAQTGDQDEPAAVRGALTLGAGRWAATPSKGEAAYDVDEPFEGATAGEAYPRYFGMDAPFESNIVYLGMPAAQRAGRSLVAWPSLGALGELLRAAGHETAAVGNSDMAADGSAPLRPAPLVSMDASAGVCAGMVGSSLLTTDPAAPYGVRTDYAALRKAIQTLRPQSGLIVVDTGDLLRARNSAWSRTAEASAADRTRALRGLDETVNWLRENSSASDRIMVVSNAVEMQAWNQPYLAPMIVAAGGSGDATAAEQRLLFSPSTHRPGLVTNLDVAPTVLGMMSVETTSAMIGAQMRDADVTAPSLEAAIAQLQRQNDFSLAVDAVRDPVVLGWLWATLGAFVVGAWFVWRRVRRGRAIARAAVLAVLALPPATWLSVVPVRYLESPQSVLVATFVWAVVLWAIAVLLMRVRRWAGAPALFLTALTAGLIVADNLAQRPWAESGIFSYSVLAGWRYYGVGNEGSALGVAAAIVAAGLAVDMARGTRGQRAMELFAMPVVGAVTLASLAGPMFGANAGVAVWGVIGFGIAWLVTAGVRLSWKTMLAALGAVVLVVLALSAIDLARGVGGETHLGRLVRSIFSGDFGYVVDLVSRKAINAWRYSADTPFTWLAAGCVAILAWLRLDKRDDLDALLARGRGFAGAMAGVLAGAVVALFTEDSGSAMPALMLTVAVATALVLALAPGDDESASEEPSSASAGGASASIQVDA